jgi:hypothetical protein
MRVAADYVCKECYGKGVREFIEYARGNGLTV